MQNNLGIVFNPANDLQVWVVGPPYLRYPKKRRIVNVHILNKGSRTLEDCTAYLEIIQSDVNMVSRRQLPLHWADTPYNALSSSITPVHINPSTEHRLDVVFSEECCGTISGCSVASAQALATGVQTDQFYFKPGKYSVRITVVSSSGDKAQSYFIIQSPDRWQDLNMQPSAKSFMSKLLVKWHGLNLSPPVKGALLGPVAAAFIGGAFLLINTVMQHFFSKAGLQEKNTTTMSAVANNSYVQQQMAETIINNPANLILPQSSAKLDGYSKNNMEYKESLQNGNFEEDFKYWTFNWSPRILTDDVATIGTQGYVISNLGHKGKCLYINNIYPEAPQKYYVFEQKLYGLKSNTTFKLSLYLRGEINSARSLKIALGHYNDWSVRGKYFYIDANRDYSDWQEQSGTLATGTYDEASLFLISADRCKIYVDDIKLEEVTE
jgi:hypothetical protein